MGFELFTLRVVSLLSTLLSAGLIFALVRFETQRPSIAIAGAGLFLATYIESGAYMDVARLDAFFVAVVLAGVAMLRMRDDAGVLKMTLDDEFFDMLDEMQPLMEGLMDQGAAGGQGGPRGVPR